MKISLRNESETHPSRSQSVPKRVLDCRCAPLFSATSSLICGRHGSGNCDPNGKKTWILHLQTTADGCCRISRAAHVQTLSRPPLSPRRVRSREGGLRTSLSSLLSLSLVALQGWIPWNNVNESSCRLQIDKTTLVLVKVQEKWQQTHESVVISLPICTVSRCFPPNSQMHVWLSVLVTHGVGLQSRLMRLEGFFFFQGSTLENSYFIGSYPDLSIIQKRLTGRGRWVGLLGGQGLDRTPWGAQSHCQTVTKTKRSVTERWWACCQGRPGTQPRAKSSRHWQQRCAPTSSPANWKCEIKIKLQNYPKLQLK